MRGDSHGYQELQQRLASISGQLRDLDRTDLALAVEHAAKFAGGSPSEFLGEARIALAQVLGSVPKAPKALCQLCQETIDRINAGFRAVGGG
jgi:predicted alpha/beta hydrolase